MKVEIDPAARAEFDAAVDYYLAHASSVIADRFISEFADTVRRLAQQPEIGAPESARSRSLHLRRFPYKPIYWIDSETVIVVAVAHQRRRPGYWAGRR